MEDWKQDVTCMVIMLAYNSYKAKSSLQRNTSFFQFLFPKPIHKVSVDPGP